MRQPSHDAGPAESAGAPSAFLHNLSPLWPQCSLVMHIMYMHRASYGCMAHNRVSILF